MTGQASSLERIEAVTEILETVTVDLGDFHESYRGATFEVWVMPTPEHIAQYKDLGSWLAQAGKDAEAALHRMYEQHKEQIARLQDEGDSGDVAALEAEYQDERNQRDEQITAKLEEVYNERLLQWIAATCLNWDVEELRQARDHLQGTNPLAWDWLRKRITSTIGEYKKRKLGTSAGG